MKLTNVSTVQSLQIFLQEVLWYHNVIILSERMKKELVLKQIVSTYALYSYILDTIKPASGFHSEVFQNFDRYVAVRKFRTYITVLSTSFPMTWCSQNNVIMVVRVSQATLILVFISFIKCPCLLYGLQGR